MAEGKKRDTADKAKAPAGAKGKGTPLAPMGGGGEPGEDDALALATARAIDWTSKHKKQLAYAIAGVIAASGIAWGVSYYRAQREQQASSLVAKGVQAELAPIRTGDEDPEIAKRLKFYGSEDEKQKEALAAFEEARAKYGDTGPGILARLGEAGIHLDRRDWDKAIAAYEEVRGSALASADPSVRVRTLEGLGYAREGKGLLDDARKAFDELANLDAKGAKPLGLYHLARVDVAKGDNAGAIGKLKAAREAVHAPGAPAATYLKDQIDKLLGRLDPTAVPKPAAKPGQIPGLPPGAGPDGKLTQEQIEAFLKSMGAAGKGELPGAPPGAPPPVPPPPAPPPGEAPAPPPVSPAPAGSP